VGQPDGSPRVSGMGLAWSDTEFVKRFDANAVSVAGATLERIGEAAAEVSAYVVIGVTEIDGGTCST